MKRSRLGWLTGTLAVALGLLALTALLRLVNAGSTTIPTELLGTWTTAAPDYAGRALQMTPTTLRLYTGAPRGQAYPVRRVVRHERGASALYTIEYGRDGEEESLSLQLVRAAQPAIRIDHQPFVWRRAAPGL